MISSEAKRTISRAERDRGRVIGLLGDHQLVDERGELVGRRLEPREQRVRLGQSPLHVVGVHVLEQPVLAAEVVQDRALAHVERLGDVAQAHVVVAALGHHLAKAADDVVLAVLALLSLPCHVSRRDSLID